MTEYFAIDPRMSVRLYVFVCVISTAQTDGLILMKLYTNHLEHICEVHLSPILNISIDDLMAPILVVLNKALSRSQICSDLLQI